MTTASAKNKGRKLQQWVCKKIIDASKNLHPLWQLKPEDVQSRSMGANGVDVILSPAATQFIGDLAFECKNTETLNVTGVFWEHYAKYPKKIPVLVHKRNKTQPLITLQFEDFLQLVTSAPDMLGFIQE